MALYVVELRQSGPRWESGRPMEEQPGWDEHAAFMNGLVDRGFLLIGGPLGANGRVLHVVRAAGEDEIRAALAEDPWSEELLVVESIEPWTLRLGELP